MKKVDSRVSPIRWVAEDPRLAPGVPGMDPVSATPVWWTNPEWEALFPWLAQGTTGRGSLPGQGDYALFSSAGSSAPRERWAVLSRALGFSSVVHSRQVHGNRILLHEEAQPGLSLGPDADGHVTSERGILMGVTVADCVPVFIVEENGKGCGVFHAGWRGVVAGIMEAGVAAVEAHANCSRDDLFLHLGPAICGECYEVGREVHEALGLSVPEEPGPVDLRAVLASRAMTLGLQPHRITRSSHCTLCGGSPFFSHRGSDPERQVGFLGLRDDSV